MDVVSNELECSCGGWREDVTGCVEPCRCCDDAYARGVIAGRAAMLAEMLDHIQSWPHDEYSPSGVVSCLRDKFAP